MADAKDCGCGCAEGCGCGCGEGAVATVTLVHSKPSEKAEAGQCAGGPGCDGCAE